MSYDTQIKPDINNADLHRAYLVTCSDASNLRFRLTSRPGISFAKFNAFKKSFDYLVTLTINRREFLNYTELTSNVREWLNIDAFRPKREHMKTGIELFEKYQKTMIEQRLISDN